jgi:hypothetical protein
MTKPWPPPGCRLVEGRQRLTQDWSLVLPEPFARRIQAGSLVLWRPSLTLWIDAWHNDRHQSQAQRLAELKGTMSAASRIVREVVAGGLTRCAYHLLDDSDEGPVESLDVLVLSDRGHLQLGIYFDDPADEAIALAIADSVTVES